MVQHINLLSKRGPTRKSAATLGLASALAIWVLGMGGMTISAELRLREMSQAEAQLQHSVEELKANLDKKRQDSGLAASEAMAKQVALLQGELDARRDWVDLLKKGELGNPLGYSQWLETLAAVHVDGVWLQGVNIGKAGQSVSISGKALMADAVLQYIEQLNAAFKPMNVRFNSMEITQDSAAGDAVASRQLTTVTFKIF